MKEKPELEQFIQKLRVSLQQSTFVKLTLSRYTGTEKELKNVYGRLVTIRGKNHLSFTLRYTTKDIVKNYLPEEGISLIALWMENDFLNGDLFTLQGDVTLQYNKRRKPRLYIKKPSHTSQPSLEHDHRKTRILDEKGRRYLRHLGITGQDGKVLKSGQKKFRQINKYIEIIDHLLRQHPLPDQPRILDMGSGKGYLTFALYDHLRYKLGLQPRITGIELRQHLVEQCNSLAEACGFSELQFKAIDINDFQADRIDMLIALHACDTATDLAIAKGIKAEAKIIIVAPCCHKQIRKQMNCRTDLQAVLKHGILEERQAELITDGIRALLLEAHGYKTRVFEFISTEHTPKNVMIVASRSNPHLEALKKVNAIKETFGIDYHFLEKLL